MCTHRLLQRSSSAHRRRRPFVDWGIRTSAQLRAAESQVTCRAAVVLDGWAGVILFWLGPYAPLVTKIARLDYVLTHYHRQLDQFLVVTPAHVRVGQPGGASP